MTYKMKHKNEDFPYKITNPTVKAVKNKNYKVDEEEDDVEEKMENSSKFDGHTEIKINQSTNKPR